MKKNNSSYAQLLPKNDYWQAFYAFGVLIITIILILISSQKSISQSTQQRKVVKGVIVNEKNEPVAGASVSVQGNNIGTTSNEAGAFSLSVPEKCVLVISYIG
jgi:hypothetical protein